MKITLTNNIADKINEDRLLDLSIIESIYEIRKLRALVESKDKGYIICKDESNNHGQVYSEKYQIWFCSDEFYPYKE